MIAIEIALKDLRQAFRSAAALVFMFGIPLLVTGMFYLMFGNIAQGDDFDLPRTRIVIANLDRSGPRLQAGRRSLPEGIAANTLSELVVNVLKSESLGDLLEISEATNAEEARRAVDQRQAQAAIILPDDFSEQFADINGRAVIELYRDPTLTIGPGIVRAILSRFIDGLAGIKIAADQALEIVYDNPAKYPLLVEQTVADYLTGSGERSGDPAEVFLETRAPTGIVQQQNPVLALVAPIMGGMLIFYAFFTGTSTAQSILREDEGRTLPRLFTTPASRRSILTGKFLGVFLTVLVQVFTLFLVARLVFGIHWGTPAAVALAGLGVVFSAATAGIFINSLLRSSRQGGVIFGGVLTFTGMLGMVRIFAMNSPAAARLGDSVGLLTPQGWAVRGLMQALDGQPAAAILPTLAALLAWSLAFFVIGAWRFNKRYV